MRVVAGRPATIRLQLATDGGSAQAPDSPPTVTVLAGDGTTVLYAAETGTAVSGQPGAYTWQMPPQSQLDQLTATWTALVSGVTWTQQVDLNVVREHLVSPFTLRSADTNLASLTDEQLLFLLGQVEDLIEDVLGFPPVLTGARQEWDALRGTLTDALYIAGTVNGLPYGWGAGRMLIPGVKIPVVGTVASTGMVELAVAVPSGTVTSIVLLGDTTGEVGLGYMIELQLGTVVTMTSSGTFNGTTTTYTVASVTNPSLIDPSSLTYTGPEQGPGAVYSGSINGVALDPVKDIPFITTINAALAWTDYRPWISGRYQMWLTHGETTPPLDIRAAASKLVSFYAKTTNYPDRAAQVVTEGATIVFALPTPDRPTGIPEIDAILVRRRLESVI